MCSDRDEFDWSRTKLCNLLRSGTVYSLPKMDSNHRTVIRLMNSFIEEERWWLHACMRSPLVGVSARIENIHLTHTHTHMHTVTHSTQAHLVHSYASIGLSIFLAMSQTCTHSRPS